MKVQIHEMPVLVKTMIGCPNRYAAYFDQKAHRLKLFKICQMVSLVQIQIFCQHLLAFGRPSERHLKPFVC